MERATLSLNYVLPEASSATGSRWLKVEQVRQKEGVSLADAAAAIDALFSIEPCKDESMGNGGQASKHDADGKPVDKPDQEEAMASLRERLDLSICEQGNFWETWVDVLKSHPTPVNVQLVSETAEIAESELIIESKTELARVTGNTHDLEWPYHSGLSVSGAQVDRVDGSTVIFAADVDGYLSIRYATSYERVRVLVPRKQEENRSTADNDERVASAIIAFWGDIATSCELEEEETDDAATEDEIRKICGRGTGSVDFNDLTPKECWKTVKHYTRCSCSREIKDGWEELVPATCPDWVQPGTHHVAFEEVFEGYVDCAKDVGDVADPSYYELKCCWSVPAGKSLPRCWTSYALWRTGGAGIKGGAEKYIAMYGPSVRLVPVAPPDGICGDIITEYRYRFKSCCDGVPEMSIDPDVAPEVMADNSEAYLQILGGMGPYTVSTASDGLYINDIGRKSLQTMSTMIRLRSGQICGAVSVHIADACGQITTHVIRATSGQWVPVSDVPPCAGAPGRPFAEGWYLNTIAGEYKLIYSAHNPTVSTNGCLGGALASLSACSDYCQSLVGPGALHNNCGIYPLVTAYAPGDCPSGSGKLCSCNGIIIQGHSKWVC